MKIAFLLNGEAIELPLTDPRMTLLDWLRERRGMTGTKEGCNEGDCGACTVMVSDARGPRALNACILFMPQLHGKSVRTVEGVAGHPVQDAMVEHHGSQCGFCTPGFIMSMTTAHARGDTDHDDALAGNLCRCTGYAPIIRAAQAAEEAPKPDWLADDAAALPKAETISTDDTFVPQTSDELAAWYAAHPDATLIGGATDTGLWVNKNMRDIRPMAFVAQIEDLRQIDSTDTHHTIGASVTVEDLRQLVRDDMPSLAEMLRRFGSAQVRGAATVGGNIANGSPIGDSPPAMIALGASLTLRHGDNRRTMALEDFFIDYGKQDRAAGEFVEAITFPKQAPALRCYKISKRFDQDISALCGCFNVTIADGDVQDARIAFGGMAATPHRARGCEAALIGQPWTAETVEKAVIALTQDYTPISDMRASATYRATVAGNLLRRYFADLPTTPVLEVVP